jgi:arylsulfatase A-like enzyme
MKRRDFLRVAGSGAAVSALGAAAPTPPPFPESQKKQPNILFIFSDQQRWDTLGCYGENTMGEALQLSPHLDAMAAEGVRFEHAFTAQPVCGPTRACLQTGLYATQTGCYRNDIALPLDAVTLPRLLKPAGYDVGYIGKWHLASQGEELNQRTAPTPLEYRGGYEDYWLAADILEFTSHSYDGHLFNKDMERVDFPKGRYRVDALTDFTVDYLRERNQEKPFFLFVSYIEPHHQNDHRHFEGPKGSKERYKDYPIPGDLKDHQGDWREEMPDYLGCCASLDASVGRLRKELETLGLADNTLIIYASDHGCHFRTRNNEYKRACHENAIRVPMILQGPGFRGGKAVSELTSLLDLPPTLLSAAGVRPPEAMQGKALQALVEDNAEDWPGEVFVQISESHVGRAIRTDRWKYSVRDPEKHGARHSASMTYVEDFLYDLRADPHEQNNRVRDPALESLRKELQERLKKRMAAAGEAIPEILPAPKEKAA